jgi:coenzyme F420-reducing hydrogenase gamma subunit
MPSRYHRYIMKEKKKIKLPLEQDLFCMGFAEDKFCFIMCPPNTLQFFLLVLYTLEEETCNV